MKEKTCFNQVQVDSISENRQKDRELYAASVNKSTLLDSHCSNRVLEGSFVTNPLLSEAILSCLKGTQFYNKDICIENLTLKDIFSSLYISIVERKDAFKFQLDKEKWAQAMGYLDEIQIDGENVIIPKRFFCTFIELLIPEKRIKQKGGRPKVKQLLNTIADSKVVSCFKETLKTVKKKCKELFMGIAQYCVCFLKGIFRAFKPKEDPYGVISHYHRILDGKVEGLPTRRTIQNHYNWFVGWKETMIMTAKEKNELANHIIWEKLIKWICDHLLKLAPQFVNA